MHPIKIKLKMIYYSKSETTADRDQYEHFPNSKNLLKYMLSPIQVFMCACLTERERAPKFQYLKSPIHLASFSGILPPFSEPQSPQTIIKWAKGMNFVFMHYME